LHLGAAARELDLLVGVALGDGGVALALLDGGLGFGLAEEDGLVLDLAAFDQLLVALVVDVAADQDRIDLDAEGLELRQEPLVGEVRFFDALRALVELFAVELAEVLRRMRSARGMTRRSSKARPGPASTKTWWASVMR